jgi:hypothetical protein
MASLRGSLRRRASALTASAALLRVLAASAFLEGVLILDSGFRLMLKAGVVLNIDGNSMFF